MFHRSIHAWSTLTWTIVCISSGNLESIKHKNTFHSQYLINGGLNFFSTWNIFFKLAMNGIFQFLLNRTFDRYLVPLAISFYDTNQMFKQNKYTPKWQLIPILLRLHKLCIITCIFLPHLLPSQQHCTNSKSTVSRSFFTLI